MIYVGIDVAKDKHDGCILNENGEMMTDAFSFPNDSDGFNSFLKTLQSVCDDFSNVKVGLEATGHYSYNILCFLLHKNIATFVLNPLQTNLFRQSTSLRRTKTDRIDARAIAKMLRSDVGLSPYSLTSYHNEELKSLTRYRFAKVQERSKLKTSVARLVTILFPELEKLVPSLHSRSVYALLSELPGAKAIAACHLTRLTHLLAEASNGRYARDKALEIRRAAAASVGTSSPAKSLELKHTISLIEMLTEEIDEVEAGIKDFMDQHPSPILTVPGINYRMGAAIVAEIGDFKRFDSPDKILAYAGLSPSTYQSGKVQNAHAHMEKRGSRYLRYALFNAARLVCRWDPVFAAYLAKKRAEGKHYNVAVSHAAKKLVRVLFALQATGCPYERASTLYSPEPSPYPLGARAQPA